MIKIINKMNMITNGDTDSGYDLKANGKYKRVTPKYEIIDDFAIRNDGELGEELLFDKYVILKPNETMLLSTGIKMDIDYPIEDYKIGKKAVGTKIIQSNVQPRSGKSLKKGLVAILGTIDFDYTGEIGVITHNNTNDYLMIEKDERIAQLVFKEIIKFKDSEFKEVLEFTKDAKKNVRGEKGFGDSDKKGGDVE